MPVQAASLHGGFQSNPIKSFRQSESERVIPNLLIHMYAFILNRAIERALDYDLVKYIMVLAEFMEPAINIRGVYDVSRGHSGCT